MKCKISIMCDFFNSETIEELNELSNECKFRIIKQKDLLISPEIITVIFEFARNISYSAAYDMLKLSLEPIISKFKTNINSTDNKETKIVVINGNKKGEYILPFKLTRKQRNKIIDAIAEKILEI